MEQNREHLQTYSGHDNASEQKNNGIPFTGHLGRPSPQQTAEELQGTDSHSKPHLEIGFNNQGMCNMTHTKTV